MRVHLRINISDLSTFGVLREESSSTNVISHGSQLVITIIVVIGSSAITRSRSSDYVPIRDVIFTYEVVGKLVKLPASKLSERLQHRPRSRRDLCRCGGLKRIIML